MPRARASASADARAVAGRFGRFARAGLPKYVALRDAIADAVAAGAWPAGTRLPNELDLARELPLALGTVQRALRLLVDERVIVRQHGQGTFVAEHAAYRMNAPLHCRFIDDSGLAYLPVRSRMLSRQSVKVAGPWTPALGPPPVLRIDRVMDIGGEFRLYSRIYVRPETLPFFEALPARALDGENFKDVIWRQTGQSIGALSQFLSTRVPPPDIAREIGTKRGVAVTLLEATAASTAGVVLYYQEFFIPPNRRRMHLAASGRDPGLGT